jgi:phospholipid-binding lipoprotein MlaA
VVRYGEHHRGLVGFFDPATRWGIARRDEDVGQMFGAGAFRRGVLVIPLLGPQSARRRRASSIGALAFTWIGILRASHHSTPGWSTW